MSVRLAIWDVDGTLVDSRKVISYAMDHAFEAVGLPAPGYEGVRHVVGLSLEEACRVLAPDACEPEMLERLTDAYKDAFVAQRSAPDHHEPLYEGARDTLERLANDGWLLGVATGKGRRGVDITFERHDLTHFFDVIRCADDGPGKPHPFMVEDAIAALGAPVEASVMIGDTAHDMVMARAAGARALGVSWGFHTPDEIAAAGAHEVHHDFRTLNAALDAFGAVHGGEPV